MEHGGEVAGEKLLLVRASGETIGLLEPVGALAGLLLTKEPLDLRHPFCPAPAVPAFNTEGAANSEKH